MPARPAPSCVLADGAAERLIAIGRAKLPNEACGLVFGPRSIDWDTDAVIEVAGVLAVRNSLESPTRFALDGRQMLDTETRIEAGGMVVLGVFHAHPTSQARPSATDLADAGRWDPDGTFLHLIVSMQGFVPTVRAWRYVSGDPVEAVELSVVST